LNKRSWAVAANEAVALGLASNALAHPRMRFRADIFCARYFLAPKIQDEPRDGEFAANQVWWRRFNDRTLDDLQAGVDGRTLISRQSPLMK
jgi:hypothetical protein